ncbi:MAG: type II toxin-antitoxin system RelE/ParE family toxin [Patescibacteria group bacterium]
MQVVLSKLAQKNFSHLPKVEQSKIRKKLVNLVGNPRIGKKLAGELGGSRSLRAWPYRIIYRINSAESLVEVSHILHRQGAYK